MANPDGDEIRSAESRQRGRSPLVRALLIASMIFAVIVGGIAVTAIFSGERSNLKFDYEGFD